MKKGLFIALIVLTGFTVNAQTSATRNDVIAPDSLLINEISRLETLIAEQRAAITELQEQVGKLQSTSLGTNYGKRAVIDRRGSKQIVCK